MAYKEKTFAGFSVGLATGSKRKQRLSNHLRIEIDQPLSKHLRIKLDGDRATISQKLTLREARALQKWLNDNLPESTSSTSTGSTTSESA